jgi:hypothetical protein
MTLQETDSDDDSLAKKKRIMVALVASAIAIHCNQPTKKKGNQITIQRKRREAESIFKELGPIYTQRAYRMPEAAFFTLHEMLRPFLQSSNRNRGCRNGVISSTIHLAAALRFFAGGSPYDLAVMHGISHSSVYESAWMVLDAINQCSGLRFTFPPSHAEQRFIAREFAKKSSAGFDCCVGAIDGILIWIEKPTIQDCEIANCGETKFYCGRKKKFGLNMMGTVDHVGRFIDVEIRHPGATSDYLCFETSTLKRKLDTPNFLAPDLVLFGDNAYVDSDCMVSPFKNPKVELGEDDFNFFHSQLRINVECAFGMLVHRWGILRRPLSAKFGLQKTTALVMALCRLHNYCINHRMDPGDPLDDDIAYNISQGGFELEGTDADSIRPTALIGGGDHFDDVSRTIRRRQASSSRRHKDRLLQSVVNQGLVRPRPLGW